MREKLLSDKKASTLFSPIAFRDLALKNRIVISPMCMYSARDGIVNDFHLVHLGRFALGGAGLVFTEATAVSDRGRITHGCAGLWRDEQIAPFKRIVDFLHQFDCAAGIQLSHAGHKASSQRPWEGGGPLTERDAEARGDKAWQPESVTASPFDAGWLAPIMLDINDLRAIAQQFAAAAKRAHAAGFDVLELHGAHGYLLHSFLSPLSNTRSDAYGGDLEGRMRFPLQTVRAVREAWPESKPLFFRISSVDGLGVGWSIEDSIVFSRELKKIGVDAIDCSSGGMKLERNQTFVWRGPGFHVPFAEKIRLESGIPTIAVGLIRDAEQAEIILAEERADLISVAREALFSPNWPNIAALQLEGEPAWTKWPDPFGWWLARRARQEKDGYGPRHSYTS